TSAKGGHRVKPYQEGGSRLDQGEPRSGHYVGITATLDRRTFRRTSTMKFSSLLRCALAASVLFASTQLLAAIQLTPVVSSGLSGPLFVVHAGDGSNRLFIEERPGTIRVLQPGASTPTLFLDIQSKVLSMGQEQGLLGLAFHPQYASNRRFFVYYTR